MKSQTNQKHYFKYVLAVDCETTGLSYGANDPSDGHQMVSIGLIVADTETFTPIEKLYIEIKWNEASIIRREQDSHFGKAAEDIHGLSFEYLQEHGVEEEEALVAIANMVLKYWGTDKAISLLGHNVATFDLQFVRNLFQRHEMQLKFANRHFDSFSVGVGTVGAYTSDALFGVMGNNNRKEHNALVDCEMALEVFHNVKTLWSSMVGVEV